LKIICEKAYSDEEEFLLGMDEFTEDLKEKDEILGKSNFMVKNFDNQLR